MEKEIRNRRPSRQGIVVSAKMDKTVVVAVIDSKKHPIYNKVVKSTKKYKAHDEGNICGVGDTVEIQETIEFLKGNIKTGDVADLTYSFASQALLQLGLFTTISEAKEHLKETIKIGQAVLVPFGFRKQSIIAFVTGFSDYLEEGIKAKEIVRIIDKKALMQSDVEKIYFE